MFEIRSKDGKRAVMFDEDTGEYFILGEDATYNGKKAEVFQTDDPYLATEVWNAFGGSKGGYEIVRVA